MEKIIKRINKLKDDKNCFNLYVKCFVNNNKANELFRNNSSFSELKDVSNKKKVS